MYQIQNRPDTATLLNKLTGILRERTGSVDQYLRQMNEEVVSNPFINPSPTAYIRIAGAMPGQALINRLGSCHIVGFTDWASERDGSDLWDGLYTDVIKPLKKRDFHFMFHLGDVTNRMVYDIDEALDIIGDYSAYGKVTLMLDNKEAHNLWAKLNGPDPGSVGAAYGAPRASEKYQFLFNTMSIDALVVQHGYSAVQLSREGKFVLPGMPPTGNVPANDKILFSSGYGMGLLLQLDPWHCLALGLAFTGIEAEAAGAASVEGAEGAPEIAGTAKTPDGGLDTARLMTYIHDWINIL